MYCRFPTDPTPPEEVRAASPSSATFCAIATGSIASSDAGNGNSLYATDLQLQREVAVKILSASSHTSDGRERLIREARAAAALNHPHIVTIHDVGEAGGLPFLVMELVAGPRLSWQNRPILRASSISPSRSAPHSNTRTQQHRPPRSETRQRVAIRHQPLEHREAGGSRSPARFSRTHIARRRDRRHRGLHGAGTGPGPTCRQPFRFVRARRPAL